MELIFLVPLFPALGSLINGVLGLLIPSYRKKEKMIHTVACGAVILSCAVALWVIANFIFLNPPHNHIFELTLFDWIVASDFKTEVGFQIDPLSCVMLFLVTFVGMLIHIYSTGYMHGEEGYYRFFTYLNLFMFSMLILILGNNFLLMFVGWEGVGLCSYLLIGYYFTKKSAADAGKKAFIVNRIGDFGFVLAVMAIFYVFGTVDYTDVFSSIEQHKDLLLKTTSIFGFTFVTVITLSLFVGAIGKSAQIPLYVWLPDAMEGPTPVSALIHAATMVTAGVYMVARCNHLFELAPFSLAVVAVVGAVTAIFSASIGLVQNDIKKVLAYSTVSQLGYMFLGCGVGAYGAGIFHLLTHGFFKACLFLGSGSIIHALSGEQDIRNMGDLKSHMPRTYWTFLFATLAIAGIPPFAGFFSKDEILFKAFTAEQLGNLRFILWGIGATSAFMTSFYMFRLVNMVFRGTSRVSREAMHHLHESPSNITIPLAILGGFSLVGGFIGIPLIPGANLFHNFLSPIFGEHHSPHSGGHEKFGLEVTLMVVSVLVAIGGMLLAKKLYIISPHIAENFKNKYSSVYKLLLNKYYVDEIYEKIIINPCKNFSRRLWKWDEKGVDGVVNGVAGFTLGSSFLSFLWDEYVVDGAVNGIGYIVKASSRAGKKLQSGFVTTYAFIMLSGIFIFVSLYLIFR